MVDNHTPHHTRGKKCSPWLADVLLAQQLHVNRLLIPLLRRELSSVVALLQKVLHHVDLHRLDSRIGCQLVLRLAVAAVDMR